MILHLKEYVNRLKKYSQELDDLALLIDQPWICKIEDSEVRCVYIFRKEGNELLISKDGKVGKGKWEYIPSMKSLLVEFNGETILYNQGFFDGSVMILKKDGTDNFQLFVNENKIETTIEKLLSDIEENANINFQKQSLKQDDESVKSPNYKVCNVKSTNCTLQIHCKTKYQYVIGDKVFVNGKPAPDGRYLYGLGFLNFLKVKDGVILENKIQERKPLFVDVVLIESNNGLTLEVHLQNKDKYCVNDNVFIDGKPAPDGKYVYGFGSGLFHIKDGKILEF